MEEAELKVHPIGLIKSLEILVNISFYNNVKAFE